MTRRDDLRSTEARQAQQLFAGQSHTHSLEFIMQVRSFTQFALIAGIAVAAAMVGIAGSAQAQELDPGETLQARNLASQTQHERDHQRTRDAVVAEVRNLQAAGQLKAAGEKSEAPAAETVAPANALTRAEVRADLAEYRKSNKVVVGELDEGPASEQAPHARSLTRDEVKAELVEWRKTHKEVVGELN